VFESGAILIYLAEKSGFFLPRDGRERVAVMEWLMFQMGGFGPILGQVHHFIALESEEERRYGLKRFMAETRRLYGVMDRRLADHAYFAGSLSIADFALLGWVWRHQRHQVDLADFPNVGRWYSSMMTRPAVIRGFAVPMRKAK
jgi:GST-like protein